MESPHWPALRRDLGKGEYGDRGEYLRLAHMAGSGTGRGDQKQLSSGLG